MKIRIKSRTGKFRDAEVVFAKGEVYTELWKAGEWWRITDPSVNRECWKARRDGIGQSTWFWKALRGTEPSNVAERSEKPVLN